MLQTIPGGAAKPFETHHNALDMAMFLRIAPELYLKRLVVGGFEKVFEINRNFRNEGVSTRHNPEFTMLEFYQAYADYEDNMDLTEELFRELAQAVLGTTDVPYGDKVFHFGEPFVRLSVFDSILRYNPEITAADLNDVEKARAIAKKAGAKVLGHEGLGKLQVMIFEELVEHKLEQPHFITRYPFEVSPLARRNDEDPSVTDRFELFIGGREDRQCLFRAERRRGPGRALHVAGQGRRTPATTRRCTTTPTSSMPWNTACRRPPAKASASTAW